MDVFGGTVAPIKNSSITSEENVSSPLISFKLTHWDISTIDNFSQPRNAEAGIYSILLGRYIDINSAHPYILTIFNSLLDRKSKEEI